MEKEIAIVTPASHQEDRRRWDPENTPPSAIRRRRIPGTGPHAVTAAAGAILATQPAGSTVVDCETAERHGPDGVLGTILEGICDEATTRRIGTAGGSTLTLRIEFREAGRETSTARVETNVARLCNALLLRWERRSANRGRSMAGEATIQRITVIVSRR